jgi:hypothetical protein
MIGGWLALLLIVAVFAYVAGLFTLGWFGTHWIGGVKLSPVIAPSWARPHKVGRFEFLEPEFLDALRYWLICWEYFTTGVFAAMTPLTNKLMLERKIRPTGADGLRTDVT